MKTQIMKTQLFVITFTIISIFSFSQNLIFKEKLLAPDGELNDRFGWAVDVQGDVLVGGDIFDNTDPLLSTGAAYIFRKDSNGNFNFEQKLKAPFLSASDNYAREVKINGDFIAIGATRYKFANSSNGFPIVDSAGAVFLYKHNPSTNLWDLVNQIFAPTRVSNRLFGQRIIITNTQLFITEIEHRYTSFNASRAGKIHVYDYDSNGNVTYNQGIDNPEPTTNDFFGAEIALSGNTLAAGTYGERLDENGTNPLNSAGAVYVFEKDGTGIYNFQQKIVPNTRVMFSSFGGGLDLNNDTLVVGAVNENRVQPGTTNTADCGIAYVFKKNGTTWSQTTFIEPPSIEFNAEYGSSINLDGNTVFISYEGGKVTFNSTTGLSGLVDQITLDNTGQVTDRFVIAPPFPDSTSEFGYMTSWDGNQLAVGAYADSGDIDGNSLNESPGAVYVYNFDTNLSTNAFSSAALKISNPVEEKITVFSLKKDSNYHIYDLNGQLIMQGKLALSNPTIDISWVTNGVYILSINIGDSYQNFKIIKT